MSVGDLETEPVAAPESNGTPPAGETWKVDKNGNEYVGRSDGRQGRITRQGSETVEEARERDGKAGEQRPRRKSKIPKKPEAPRKVDLKELEKTLVEAFKSPALICAMAGDEWATEHFTHAGPYLARNLVAASEHNPWLRRKLEEAALGGDAMMKVLSLVPVGGALFIYIVPPVIWWFNLPVPERARVQFGIPPRREPEHAASPAQPTPAEFAPAA